MRLSSFIGRAVTAFTLAALVTAAAQPAPRRYAITSGGALGDGQSSNTRAIQNLIDRAAQAGGGTLVVPAGTFVTGALFFKQGVNLSIEKGGVLKGSVNPEDYPQVQTRWEGTEREWTSALLNFTGMTDVELSGEGTVDGSGDEWLARGGGRGQVARAPEGAAAPSRPRAGRPRMICFQNCRRGGGAQPKTPPTGRPWL